MNYIVVIIICLALLASINAIETSSVLKKSLSKLTRNPLIPKNFDTVKSSLRKNKRSTLQAQVGFIMVNIYDSKSCSSNISTIFSMPTNECMVGNYNGVPVGSLAYTFLGAGDGYFEFATLVFNSLDCSDGPDVSEMKVLFFLLFFFIIFFLFNILLFRFQQHV